MAFSQQAGREPDYLEIGLESGVCYNPLHNDLDPYAVAYAIATLLNNLFGKSKEPFWQQAYTDLLKFVILLRRITDGYTTLSEVYRYILEDVLIDKNIRTLTAQFKDPPDVIIVSAHDYHGHCAAGLDAVVCGERWRSAHPYDAELEIVPRGTEIPFRVARTNSNAWLHDRRHQLEAIQRWYNHGWRQLDSGSTSSITEGIVVFLSLFDDNPPVYRAFCPPRSAYAGQLKPGEPRPLAPARGTARDRHTCSH